MYWLFPLNLHMCSSIDWCDSGRRASWKCFKRWSKKGLSFQAQSKLSLSLGWSFWRLSARWRFYRISKNRSLIIVFWIKVLPNPLSTDQWSLILGSLWISIKMFIPRNAHSSSNVVWIILPFCSAYLSDSVFSNESNPSRPTVFANTCIGDGSWTPILTIPSSAKTFFHIRSFELLFPLPFFISFGNLQTV